DLEVGPFAPAALGEFGDGPDDGLGRRADVVRTPGPGPLQELVAPIGDGRDMAGQHGPEDLVTVAEVVVNGGRIALVGGPDDFGDGDVVDAAFGEETGGGIHQHVTRRRRPGHRSESSGAEGRSGPTWEEPELTTE